MYLKIVKTGKYALLNSQIELCSVVNVGLKSDESPTKKVLYLRGGGEDKREIFNFHR